MVVGPYKPWTYVQLSYCWVPLSLSWFKGQTAVRFKMGPSPTSDKYRGLITPTYRVEVTSSDTHEFSAIYSGPHNSLHLFHHQLNPPALYLAISCCSAERCPATAVPYFWLDESCALWMTNMQRSWRFIGSWSQVDGVNLFGPRPPKPNGTQVETPLKMGIRLENDSSNPSFRIFSGAGLAVRFRKK